MNLDEFRDLSADGDDFNTFIATATPGALLGILDALLVRLSEAADAFIIDSEASWERARGVIVGCTDFVTFNAYDVDSAADLVIERIAERDALQVDLQPLAQVLIISQPSSRVLAREVSSFASPMTGISSI